MFGIIPSAVVPFFRKMTQQLSLSKTLEVIKVCSTSCTYPNSLFTALRDEACILLFVSLTLGLAADGVYGFIPWDPMELRRSAAIYFQFEFDMVYSLGSSQEEKLPLPLTTR